MNDSPNRDMVIFTEAIELLAGNRAAYLANACGNDAELRGKVEVLLQTYDHVGDFMEDSPHKVSIEARAESSAGEKPGDRIGRYKLLQQIGEGGWGVVFMAEQEEPVRRKVALKVVKPGMDTKTVIARFEAERQALALMDHPNIAHVFDAGATENSRPYFVMELVRGIKITDYCNQNHLPTAQRLELFIQVCDAVQHAHQKGIIHRDIKPSNILVTTSTEGKPLPKAIDFGIAKAITGLRLTDKTLFTAFEMLIGTPAYMSPEQAALTSLDVDTRTDIYSLGVLLYELLTGTIPFDTRELLKAGLDEVRRVIREEEPVRPSTRLSTIVGADQAIVSKHHGTEAPRLIREMRGDLDWIVMKALEKERARRYETANGFAMDVRRYLSGEAILARPPSAAYKLRKLIARNKLVFSGVSLIFVLLVVSLIATTRWLMIERQTQEDMRQKLEIARLESMALSLFYDNKYAESEQMLRKALALRRQSYRTELIPVLNIRMLLTELVQQKKIDEIRPALGEFLDPALLSRPEYKKLSQYKELYQTVSWTLANLGKWNDAAALAEALGKSGPTNSEYFHLRAPLLVVKGDVKEYRRLCGEIVSRFRNTTDPYVADKMAKDCLILPSAGVDLKSVAALADVAVSRGSNAAAAPYFKFCKALAQYRLGHYQAATNWAGLAIQGSFDYPRASAAAVMAMSQFRLNQLDNARATLAYCNKVIEEKMPKFGQDLGGDWVDWIIAHALQSEAKELIDVKPR
ncbi:MAG TPA: serine/threonine-protein kinase [Verrucomicrobiae bacterium]